MFDPSSPHRSTLRQEWVRYRSRALLDADPRLRAGMVDGVLPRIRLEVSHTAQQEVSLSVPQCAAMVLDYYGRDADVAWLAELLRTDDLQGTPGERLEWLRPWGYRIDFPRRLQFFRDGTVDLNERVPRTLANPWARLVYRWERPWLRYVARALEEGVPPVLFVDLGRLYPTWRGVRQPHAVVLSGGDAYHAWINDPSQAAGPTRVRLMSLMNSLLPGQPLAALVRPDGDLSPSTCPEEGGP